LATRHLDLGALGRREPLLDPLLAHESAVADTPAAQRVDRTVVDDAEQPRANASAVAVIARPAAPQRQTRLLHDVLREGAVGADPTGERERGVGMAVVDHLERSSVATTHELHQLLVG